MPLPRLPRSPWSLHAETLALLCGLFFAVFSNRLFFRSALDGVAWQEPRGALLAVGLWLALVALHTLILLPLLYRWTFRPVLALLIVSTAFAGHFMERFHVFLDPTMLRNVIATDVREARDLMSWGLIPHLLLHAVLPLWLLWQVRLKPRRLLPAVGWRLGTLVLVALVGVGALLLNFQAFASLMRNHKEVRYLITPANYLYSMGRVLGSQAREAGAVRQPIGTDAKAGPGLAAATRPRLLVMVVGETARAANWQLSGYARATNPELSREDVINFAQVSACGTNTETSVPCMFAPVGRRQYDEDRIRTQESLLDVAARAGYRVVWIDNQSGCKGVCAGVESISITAASAPEFCRAGECHDEALVGALRQTAEQTSGNLLVVLHQMGNHGPAYFKRYPATFRFFEPACESVDLPKCSREHIVNAYDNALRYTDHVLARIVRLLRDHPGHDSALLYASDHGESLGERGLFLHGIPYAIAPEEQTRVPMVWWHSAAFARAVRLDANCLKQRATQPAAHDHLFHTVLGVLDIQTSLYVRDLDVTAGCRP